MEQRLDVLAAASWQWLFTHTAEAGQQLDEFAVARFLQSLNIKVPRRAAERQINIFKRYIIAMGPTAETEQSVIMVLR